MSQAIRNIVMVLAVLLVITIGLAAYMALQKKGLEDRNQNLQEQISESQKKQDKALDDLKKLQQKTDDLQQRLTDSKKQYDQVQSSNDELKRKADELTAQMEQVSQEKENWKNRIETMRKERDDLMNKLKNAPEKIVYKDRPVEVAAVPPASGNTDEYWASVLKQKAQLQVQLDKANADLNNDALIVADLRKQTTDLQMQIKELNADKDEIDRRLNNEKKELMDNFTKEKQDFEKEKQSLQRKIKDSEDLAANLSMEAARARGDQKNANDFVGKIKADNVQLQAHVRQLVSTKIALEKTVARLTEEKLDVKKKLSETEGVIQDRINEIWQIKSTLDQKISQINNVKNKKDVELAPIVVNASGHDAPAMAGVITQAHKIISINEKNNFVIVDYGESQGSVVGRVLKAYRDDKEIGSLEVIQVRRDISAADIKDSKMKLQIGDQVR